MLQNLKSFDHFAQHFDRPLTKQTMKALMDLTEHGCPKNKKATTRLRVEQEREGQGQVISTCLCSYCGALQQVVFQPTSLLQLGVFVLWFIGILTWVTSYQS